MRSRDGAEDPTSYNFCERHGWGAIGIHWKRHIKPDAPRDSKRDEDLLFGPHSLGHGSFSGCIFLVDPDQELIALGFLDPRKHRLPRMVAVQASGCAPMVRAWERGLDEAEPVQPDTLISVLATGDPALVV